MLLRFCAHRVDLVYLQQVRQTNLIVLSDRLALDVPGSSISSSVTSS